jgi:hypothetical protein
MSENQKLIKTAAAAIKQLKAETDELRSKVASSERVKSIVSGLHESGSIASEDIMTVMDKLASKSSEELDVIEKAIELQGSGNSDFTFGKLSDSPQDDGSLDPLTRMLLEEY